jgi:hypothetical protein
VLHHGAEIRAGNSAACSMLSERPDHSEEA